MLFFDDIIGDSGADEAFACWCFPIFNLEVHLVILNFSTMKSLSVWVSGTQAHLQTVLGILCSGALLCYDVGGSDDGVDSDSDD